MLFWPGKVSSGVSDHGARVADANLDAVPCGLLRTAEDGTILQANQMFCSWIGVEAATLLGVRRFQDLLTMGARIFHQTHWAPLLRMQGSISEVELDVRRHDGGTLPVGRAVLRFGLQRRHADSA